jgi:putative exporter of polyketide antibiotics
MSTQLTKSLCGGVRIALVSVARNSRNRVKKNLIHCYNSAANSLVHTLITTCTQQLSSAARNCVRRDAFLFDSFHHQLDEHNENNIGD